MLKLHIVFFRQKLQDSCKHGLQHSLIRSERKLLVVRESGCFRPVSNMNMMFLRMNSVIERITRYCESIVVDLWIWAKYNLNG
jgi:hypothetical protein